MTFCAILAEFVFMDVGMAGNTVIEFQSFEFLVRLSVPGRHFMASGTGNLLVFSGQPVSCRCMIEQGCRFELFEIVAFFALCGQRLLMIVGVARETILIQAEIGEFLLFQDRIG